MDFISCIGANFESALNLCAVYYAERDFPAFTAGIFKAQFSSFHGLIGFNIQLYFSSFQNADVTFFLCYGFAFQAGISRELISFFKLQNLRARHRTKGIKLCQSGVGPDSETDVFTADIDKGGELFIADFLHRHGVFSAVFLNRLHISSVYFRVGDFNDYRNGVTFGDCIFYISRFDKCDVYVRNAVYICRRSDSTEHKDTELQFRNEKENGKNG